MNLDLGSIIILDVSRKLLSFHRYFFSPNIPRAMMRELKHHSHTHPTANITSSSTSHTHVLYVTNVNCGYGSIFHRSNFSAPAANSHTHTADIYFDAANLGSPWDNHVHNTYLAGMASGGGAHSHSIPLTSSNVYCIYCRPDTHYHDRRDLVTDPDNTDAGGAAHTHTSDAVNSGTANAGGTPLQHTHNYTITVAQAGGHSHTYTITVITTICAQGYDHNHAQNPPSNTVTHNHSYIGTSGLGGEALPTAEEIITGLEQY